MGLQVNDHRQIQPALISAQVRDATCPFLIRAMCDKVSIQEILRYRQTMCKVADRAELPGSLCAKPLTPQAGGNCFNIARWKLISKAGHTITLFCIRESLTNCGIKDEPELPARARLMMTQTLGIPAAAGDP